MGIKGIYRELGSGQRVSLAKLATEHLESSGRPLRVAIDIAIWQFQTQAARGGTNPAIRTLFYRLVRLLGLAIHPIFVFDGPHKPAFKRNKRSGKGGGVATAMAKRLIRLFGFPVHDAPGEAEAECALLQQQGIVDAVLSEDVDTIMFGCTRTLRNWSSEGIRGSKTPTHVSLYDVDVLLSAGTGLDREGMVLVALMSGGDYIPEGVPGCGVKLACEAAKAGFGKSLCRLKIDEPVQFEEWRAFLKHQLRTNESGFFRTKHKALAIPDEFPSRQVLRHYTHPVVSNAETIDQLRARTHWNRQIDVQGLRYFVDETFEWANKAGAVKLTRVLSQSLLVHKLLDRHLTDRCVETTDQMERDEATLIKRISGRRNHHSTDGILELRVSHVPADIVGLDMSQEMEDEPVSFDRHGLALNSDDDFHDGADAAIDITSEKSKARTNYDPTISESTWLPESLLKLSVPITVEDWEEAQRAKESSHATTKVNKKRTSKLSAKEAGGLDKWFRVTKSAPTMKATADAGRTLESTPKDSNNNNLTPPAVLPRASAQAQVATAASLRSSPVRSSTCRSKQSSSTGKATAAEPTGHKNPWAYGGSQHMPRITKFQPSEPIFLSSSPLHSSLAPPCAPLTSSPAPDIVDLSGPDDILTSKQPKTSARYAAPKIQMSCQTERIRATTSDLPLTLPKGNRSMKQTRMDSFITSSPRRQQASRDILASLSDDEEASPELDTGAKETNKPSSVIRETASSDALSQPTPDLKVWTVDERSSASQSETMNRYKKTVPRTSAVGFFKEVDICDEENEDRACGLAKQSATKSSRRRSVSIIDLTGDD
ncbi:flap structure-specific endonuclease [Colletotrichum camelliae]|nr:flap structure-specific endonuclease [Colletotrichum camelliae]